MALSRRCLVLVIPAIILSLYLLTNLESVTFTEKIYDVVDEESLNKYVSIHNQIWRNLSDNDTQSFSRLGKILYLNQTYPNIPNDRTYKILVWKYGSTIEKRHFYYFGKERHNPLEDCSVQNCIITYKNEDLNTADIVLIHLHRTKGLSDLPPQQNRNGSQIWAFLTDESPFHTFLNPKISLKEFNSIFNWSMTYKMNSDIPVPYGRVVKSSSPEKYSIIYEFNKWRRTKRNDVLVAIMGSNCGAMNHRWKYVKELQKYMDVDTYGLCGTLKCPGHFGSDCRKLNNYLFYLAFENSNCDDYLTEKLWWNAFSKNSIPIIMGPARANLEKLLPHRSYISVDEFAAPRDLAAYLLYLNRTETELISYFAWKSQYTVLNEHGYFKSKSYHYCRVCEALNYNTRETKIYKDIESFWSKKDCYPAWDE